MTNIYENVQSLIPEKQKTIEPVKTKDTIVIQSYNSIGMKKMIEEFSKYIKKDITNVFDNCIYILKVNPNEAKELKDEYSSILQKFDSIRKFHELSTTQKIENYESCRLYLVEPEDDLSDEIKTIKERINQNLEKKEALLFFQNNTKEDWIKKVADQLFPTLTGISYDDLVKSFNIVIESYEPIMNKKVLRHPSYCLSDIKDPLSKDYSDVLREFDHLIEENNCKFRKTITQKFTLDIIRNIKQQTNMSDFDIVNLKKYKNLQYGTEEDNKESEKLLHLFKSSLEVKTMFICGENIFDFYNLYNIANENNKSIRKIYRVLENTAFAYFYAHNENYMNMQVSKYIDSEITKSELLDFFRGKL